MREASWSSFWRSCPRQEFGEIVIHARYPEIRLALERPPQIVNAVRVAALKLHDGKDEVVGLVEAIQNLVLRHSDGIRTGHPPFDLDESELAILVRCAEDAALYIVAELLELTV